ncbi:hypothetical protein GS491_19055 [Rhodococcus hoagii]|nr:hypothetical protein [Prescottella equi]NKT01830.1 hypothetical protein [Prescottella equi]
MTDTITPASLRAHADHFAGRWHLVSEALIDEAARLEAESARDEEAEQLACARRGYMADQYDWMEWPHLSDVVRTAEIDGMRFILDRLAADGRLLPEGGAADRVCELRNPDSDGRFMCTLPKGHSGGHIAMAGSSGDQP